MADFHTWVKDLPGIIKSYWVLIPMIFATFGGLGTGGYHWLDKQEAAEKAEIEKNMAVREVAIGFQQAIQPVTTPKKVTAKPDCGSCGDYFNKVIDKKINAYNAYHIDKTH